ncbi:MAG: cell wall hydrolase [Ruminococcus sp.]|nr:cell wall hydrolase [Ruminococcus sp.]MBR1864422.1 cell wall hydrolase [Ruminococcus sp.]
MKQKRSRDVKASAKPSVRKTGAVLGAGALCILTVGTISVCGLFGQNNSKITENDTSSETMAAEVTTTTTTVSEREPETEDIHTSLDTVAWRKASINEYEIAEVSAPKTTTETSKAAETEKETKKTTVSEAGTKTETSAEEKKTETKTTTRSTDLEKVTEKTYYVISPVNLRAGASRSDAVIDMLDKGESVVVTAASKDGVWFAVKHGGTEGYATAESFTEKKPEEETVTTTPKVSEEVKAEPAGGVISYTADEFEMLCYVLQNEVGNCSEASKIAVANVIINRVKSSQFPNSISGVLTTPGQFDAIYNYYYGYMPPSQNTRDCAARALAGEDNTNGATYYYAPQYCSGSTAAWFESLNLCLEVDGQRYFKNW